MEELVLKTKPDTARAMERIHTWLEHEMSTGSRGNIIRYNYFHHIGNPNRMNMGIYCDDSSTDVLVYGNLIVGGPEDPIHLMGGEHAQGESVNNYRTDSDPGFVDYENGDFNLRPDSEVFDRYPGFEALPFDKMGLYIDQYRKSISEKTRPKYKFKKNESYEIFTK